MNVGDLVNRASVIFEPADGQGTLDFFNIDLEDLGSRLARDCCRDLRFRSLPAGALR
jgi:hypothetical protein